MWCLYNDTVCKCRTFVSAAQMILWDQARRKQSATASRSGAAEVASRRANTAKGSTKLLPGLISGSVSIRQIGKINLCTTVTNSPQEKKKKYIYKSKLFVGICGTKLFLFLEVL